MRHTFSRLPQLPCPKSNLEQKLAFSPASSDIGVHRHRILRPTNRTLTAAPGSARHCSRSPEKTDIPPLVALGVPGNTTVASRHHLGRNGKSAGSSGCSKTRHSAGAARFCIETWSVQKKITPSRRGGGDSDSDRRFSVATLRRSPTAERSSRRSTCRCGRETPADRPCWTGSARQSGSSQSGPPRAWLPPER